MNLSITLPPRPVYGYYSAIAGRSRGAWLRRQSGVRVPGATALASWERRATQRQGRMTRSVSVFVLATRLGLIPAGDFQKAVEQLGGKFPLSGLRRAVLRFTIPQGAFQERSAVGVV